MTGPETCPHFQTRIEKLSLELTTALLPIRRCLLAERLVSLLRTKPEANAVVDAFVRDPDSEVPYCICGPDLDIIEHGKCVRARCANSCLPAYREMLAEFDTPDDAVIGCEEPAPVDAR